MAVARDRRAGRSTGPKARTLPACWTRASLPPPRRSVRKASRSALAAVGESDERLVEELADLWFHSYVLLAARGLDPARVEEELRRRH